MPRALLPRPLMLPGLLVAATGSLLVTVACSPAGIPPAKPPGSAAEGRPPALLTPATAALAATSPFGGPPRPPVPAVPQVVAALAPAALPLPAATEPPADDRPEIVEAAAHRPRRSVAVLQIGDSHTAADYFTGEVRRILQARYGDGGLGYLDVGRPHVGVHKVDLAVTASTGWTYSGIQQPSANTGQFALTGFLAQTSLAGQTLGFAAEGGAPATDIDIEAQKGPDEGAIDVLVDGRVVLQAALTAPERSRALLHIALPRPGGSFRRLDIRTTTAKPVTVLSVAATDGRGGLTYSNIGFPGATVDILNKFPKDTVTEALHRLAPRVVVLSFGTNEGFNDNLDLARYRERYEGVIRTIRAGAPDARIVMIGPAYANRAPPDCRKDTTTASCRPAPALPEDAARAVHAADDAAHPPGADCPWPTPPQLDRVRALQRDIAATEGLAFWDWSSIMPKHCGAEAWATSVPRLMTADHVHFTIDGYKRSGRAFASVLSPIIDESLRDTHAVSND